MDRVLVVDCSVETQIARVMSRNGFSRDQVLAIIARQATREARLAAADDVIDNDNAPLDALKAQVDAQASRVSVARRRVNRRRIPAEANHARGTRTRRAIRRPFVELAATRQPMRAETTQNT